MEERNPKRVGVVLKHSSPEAVKLGRQLLVELERLEVETVLDSQSAEAMGNGEGVQRSDLASRVDLVVVLGGDGTLLSVAHGFGGTPILGVNMGTLGFLTEHPADALFTMLHAALEGRAQCEIRERLEVSVLTPGRETISIRTEGARSA